MKIARVIGSTVSTVKHPGLVGAKLLVVQPTSPTGQPSGEAMVAVDSVGAGEGETVLVVTGGAAQRVEQVRDTPVDAVVVAIIDKLVNEGGDDG